MNLFEDWRGALDRNEYVAAVLMGLSKVFDRLPHDILLSKLSAYGLQNESVQLLNSYLSSRKQQVKLNSIASSWSLCKKGVPHVSILGPLLFNVFINDIFYFIDTTMLCFSRPELDRLTQVLQSESQILINWFHNNCIQAKFQAIAAWERTFEEKNVLKISDVEIKCEEVVKLLKG